MISGNRVLLVRLERLSTATETFGKPLTIFSFLSMRSNIIYCCRRYTQVPSWLAAQRLFQHKSNQKQFLFKKLIQFNLFFKEMADSEADTASIISASTNASMKGRSSSRHKSSKSDKDKEKEKSKPSKTTKTRKHTDEDCEFLFQNFL